MNGWAFAVRAEMVGDVSAVRFELVAVVGELAADLFDAVGKRPGCFADFFAEPAADRFGDQIVVEAAQPPDFADRDSHTNECGNKREHRREIGDDLGDVTDLHRVGVYRFTSLNQVLFRGSF